MRRRMSKRQALETLISNAAANVAGAGCGIRAEVTNEKRTEVANAILVLWKDVYNYPPDEGFFRNRGLLLPQQMQEQSCRVRS